MNSTKHFSKHHYITCFFQFASPIFTLSRDHLIFSNVPSNSHTMMEILSFCQPFNQSKCSKTINKLCCGWLKCLLSVEFFIISSWGPSNLDVGIFGGRKGVKFAKFADGGRYGSKIVKICLRLKWMLPYVGAPESRKRKHMVSTLLTFAFLCF